MQTPENHKDSENKTPFSVKLRNWDERKFKKINEKGNKKIITLMKTLTFFGRAPFWLAITAYFILIYIDFFHFLIYGNVLFFGYLLIKITKKLVNRKRPYEKFPEIKIYEPKHNSSSFPSWYSYNAFAYAFVLGYLSKNPWIYIFLLIIASYIGYTRIRLGANYPLDVIAGAGLGFIGFALTLLSIDSWLIVIDILEKYSPISFVRNDINPLLQNWWYILIVIVVFLFIIYIALKNQINKRLKRE